MAGIDYETLRDEVDEAHLHVETAYENMPVDSVQRRETRKLVNAMERWQLFMDDNADNIISEPASAPAERSA